MAGIMAFMMRKKQVRHLFHRLRQLRRRRRTLARIARAQRRPGPPAVDPVWPLPRHPNGPSDDEIRAQFAKHSRWYYAYEFDGGLDGSPPGSAALRLDLRNGKGQTARADGTLQRFRHFMPWLLQATGGNLRGRRVLDIACNSGFWSLQCALLGAEEVVGFDARPELIEQARYVQSVVGVENVNFRVLDFWQMSRETLGGPFDVVLNLGILYHLPKPLEALELCRSLAREYMLLDTAVYPARHPLIRVAWEEPLDIRLAASGGIVMFPSKPGIELMLKHVGLRDCLEIPLRTTDMPLDYLTGDRASWLIRLPGRAAP
ncbi:MAG: methyltransferase domain-containing protein [Deltaproteobacteria bacterium]|nr:MAG: methyltransferase domain-containing protein [Deltaproteobacteria bacterium]